MPSGVISQLASHHVEEQEHAASHLDKHERPVGVVLRDPRGIAAVPHRLLPDDHGLRAGPGVALLALFQL